MPWFAAPFGTRMRARGLRVPSVLRATVLAAAKWFVIGIAVEASLAFGRRTALGLGLLGATVPLLLLEAWIAARRRWRARLLHTLSAAVPAFSLLTLVAVTPGSCCMCDQSPWARALRDYEFVGNFLYCNALATLPVFALLAALRRESAPPAERRAYAAAMQSALLAMLLSTVAFGGVIYLLWLQASFM